MAKLWDFENEGRTQVRWNKRRRRPTKPTPGGCFGYSLMWVGKMLDGVSAKLSMPNIVGALPLQQKVEAIKKNSNWDASIIKVINDLGYQSALSKTGHITSVLIHFATNPGYYVYDIGHHFLGLGNNSSAEWYYFDSNDGLYQFGNRKEAIDFIVGDIQDNYMEDTGFQINMNKIYLVRK